MQEFQSGHDVCNIVGMLRTSFKGSFLLLEGGTDCSVMDSFVDPVDCKTISLFIY